MKTQYLELNGGKIAYDDSGAGPLVLCAPSLGDLRGEYRFLAPLLVEAGYRVITMDLRGLGESSPNWPDYSVAAVGSDMLALIRSLDAGPAILVGTSMAAGAAIWAEVEAPELVNGLVLIGPAVHGEVGGPAVLLYRLLFSRPWGPGLWIKYFNGLFPTHKPDDFAAYTGGLLANLKQAGRLKALREMALASKRASEARLSQVKAPALIVMGAKDPDFKPPEAEARWVADRISGQVVMLPEAGHYPHAEMPEKTAPEILRFLETIAVQQGVTDAA